MVKKEEWKCRRETAGPLSPQHLIIKSLRNIRAKYQYIPASSIAITSRDRVADSLPLKRVQFTIEQVCGYIVAICKSEGRLYSVAQPENGASPSVLANIDIQQYFSLNRPARPVLINRRMQPFSTGAHESSKQRTLTNLSFNSSTKEAKHYSILSICYHYANHSIIESFFMYLGNTVCRYFPT